MARDEIDEILQKATPEQIKWVLARVLCPTDAEAARHVGMARTSIYDWVNKAELDRAVQLLLAQKVRTAALILSDASPKAAQTLVDSLGDKRRKLDAANSILDRTGVVVTQKVDITSGGQAIRDVLLSRLSRVAAAGSATDNPGQPERTATD